MGYTLHRRVILLPNNFEDLVNVQQTILLMERLFTITMPDKKLHDRHVCLGCGDLGTDRRQVRIESCVVFPIREGINGLSGYLSTESHRSITWFVPPIQPVNIAIQSCYIFIFPDLPELVSE